MVVNLLFAIRISAQSLSSVETHFSNFKRMQSLIHVGRSFTRIHHHIEGPPQLSPGQGLGGGNIPQRFTTQLSPGQGLGVGDGPLRCKRARSRALGTL